MTNAKRYTGLDVTEIRDELSDILSAAIDSMDDDAQGIEIPVTLVYYDAPIPGEYRRYELLHDGAQPRATVIARAAVVMTDDTDVLDDDTLALALQMVREVHDALTLGRTDINAAVMYENKESGYWEVIGYDLRGNRVLYLDSNGVEINSPQSR